MTFNPAASKSRWFGGPPLADVTPRERALLDELAGAIAWAEGLVQVGWRHTTGYVHAAGEACMVDACGQPVYVVREAR